MNHDRSASISCTAAKVQTMGRIQSDFEANALDIAQALQPLLP